MRGMFYNCTSLTNIDLSNQGGNRLGNVSGMFAGCTHLTNVNMSGFNFGNCTFPNISISEILLSYKFNIFNSLKFTFSNILIKFYHYLVAHIIILL